MSGQRIPFYTVDAFTDTPFAGNPAAVCLDIEDLPDQGMLTIAREMNLSETAFIYAPGGDGLRRLRWFTPAVEVPLCGHATLASAHVLLRELGGHGPIRFLSASGPLTVFDEGSAGLRMDFPADVPEPADAPPDLFHALDIPVPTGRFLRGRNLALLMLDREEEVMALSPDFGALGRVDLGKGSMGIAVTAPGSETDFVSRFFAPWVGVDEDPVTGVAHTVLTPFWSRETGQQRDGSSSGPDPWRSATGKHSAAIAWTSSARRRPLPTAGCCGRPATRRRRGATVPGAPVQRFPRADPDRWTRR